ncbi:MAG: DUF1735 and LamG domain-containing protein [Niabella sp.]|nr:DUF1735 and LamG domain-containing protein [Niabella sp.]
MKLNKINTSLYLFLLLFLGTGLQCKKGGGAGKGDAIYMTGAEVGNLTVFYASRAGNRFAFSASATNLAPQDEEVEFIPRPELVAEYNNRYRASYVALPEGKYTLSKTTGTIKKGELRSESIALTITDPEVTEKGPVYMLPVTVQKKGSGGYPVLEGSKTLYIGIAKATEGSVVELTGLGAHISPLQSLRSINPKLENLSKVTLEGRVKIFDMSGFLPTIFGAEESFIIRIESLNRDDYPITVAGSPAKTPTLTKFSASTNVWYHVAAVFDAQAGSLRLYVNGKLQAVSDVGPNATVNISRDNWKGFHIGAYDVNGDRPILAQFSEVRIWSTARTQSEIATTACVVDPAMPGLEAYWRLNEGEGEMCHDATGHGHTARIYGSYKWVTGVKCGD